MQEGKLIDTITIYIKTRNVLSNHICYTVYRRAPVFQDCR